MELGMVGLGRMGASMVRRLLQAGHRCVVYDMSAKAVAASVQLGAVGSGSLAELVQKLERPRTVWLMVPAGVVDDELKKLVPLLEEDDVIIDGGNSYYHDDIRRAVELKAKGLHYVDTGTSGGVWGADRGYCLMIGGEAEVVGQLGPDLPQPVSRDWRHVAHSGTREHERDGGAGLFALRRRAARDTL